MDPDEFDLRQEELALRRKELRTQRRDLWITAAASALVAIIGIAATTIVSRRSMDQTVDLSRRQMEQTQQQFEQAIGVTVYGGIIDGLASESEAVQQSSLRRLVRHVGDPNNFTGQNKEQAYAIIDAVQAIQAFIQSKSAQETPGILSDYNSRVPDIALRAAKQLKELLALEQNPGTALDLSAVDLHGASLTGFKLPGPTLFVRADLRRAGLSGSNFVKAGKDVDFTSASLICANLRDAQLGKANLRSADLTGADLRGADLRYVKNLTESQLRHVRVDERTQWRPGFSPPALSQWDTAKCGAYTRLTAGMLVDQSYLPDIGCPTSFDSWQTIANKVGRHAKASDVMAFCSERAAA